MGRSIFVFSKKCGAAAVVASGWLGGDSKTMCSAFAMPGCNLETNSHLDGFGDLRDGVARQAGVPIDATL
jgi:hypothetical protein